ncbi:MAG: DUF6531 domain-containing protein, partial [Povalibacter sp.]
RAGAVSNAQPNALRSGLARGLAPLYSPDSSLEGVARTVARINAELLTDARIRVLNPTREAFDDFGEEVEGVIEIPNDRLHARSTTVGASSGINIQDANLLRVQITYGYELKVPLVNWFISRVLLAVRRGGANMDPFEQQLLRRMRLPIIATSNVRMQSPARMSDMVVARADLPDVPRFAADSRPPEPSDEDDDGDEEHPGDTGDGADDGSTLADGFFGFGEGHSDGGAITPGGGNGGSGTGSGGGNGSGGTGGGNSGNPAQCTGGGDSSPFPPSTAPPGDSSPVLTQSDPLAAQSASNASSATLPNVSLPSLSVGNPIHVVTGNKFQAETDLASLPGELALGFVRYYNTDAVAHAGVVGAGWRHSYEASLTLADDLVDLWQADGRHLSFARTREHTKFKAKRAGDGTVEQIDSGYVWRWSSGRALTFNEAGKLISINDRAAETRLVYDVNGRLERVIDPQRRELRFNYFANGRLSQVRAPGKMTWRYLYDAQGNLSYSIAVDGRARRYEYTDTRHPHHLTAISAGMFRLADYGQSPSFAPIAHWAYDEQGRGILSSHPDDAGKVTLEYRKNSTIVTDAFGRATEYVTELRDGVAFVREVRGPGCGCGRGDAQYSVTPDFQLSEVAVKGTAPVRYHYDEKQRLDTIERDQGSGFAWVTRYRYEGEGTLPVRIEAPSIKPDAVRSFALDYFSNGQLKSVQEQGYSPASNGSYVAIQRSTQWIYDSHGRLTAIDGPRSDVADLVRFEYDGLGRRVAVMSPQGIEERIEKFDDTGRAVLISRTGQPTTRYDYDPAGRLTDVVVLRSRAERKTHYEYDDQGRLERVTDADGRIQRLGYDAAGRPDRLSSDDGALAAALKYAPDGNVVASVLLTAGGAPLRGLKYVYDENRRLKEIRDGDGPPMRELVYLDDDARPDQFIDSLGANTALTYSSIGAVSSFRAPDGGLTEFERDLGGRLARIIAPNRAEASYVYDDFGRRVREHTADRGDVHYQYDARDNLIEK